MRRLNAAEKGERTDDFFDEPPPLRHEVNYAIRTWLDHKKHGSYPQAGGYDDQDSDLMEDWHTLTLFQLRVENGLFMTVRAPDNAPSIDTLMGD